MLDFLQFYQFCSILHPDYGKEDFTMQISTKSDLVIIQQQYYVETRYKKKTDKVHSVNVLKSTENKSEEELDWKKKIYEKLKLHKHKENKMFKNMYMSYIKWKFSEVVYNVWLISKQIE